MNDAALGKLLNKQAQVQARIETFHARKEAQERKDDTRRKILAGSYILDKHEKGGTSKILVAELDKFLFRKRDRELFGLPPREE